MGEVAANGRRPVPMQSAVNWALLGLIIERPSYAYELAQRFERTYDGVLALSSVSHVYTALGTLESREIIEEIPDTRAGRQPRPHYRATAKGVAEYRDWFVTQVREDRRRQRLFTLQLASLVRTPGYALDVLDRCEQACHAELDAWSRASSGSDVPNVRSTVTARLVQEDDRLAVGAKLAWTRFAREQIVGLHSNGSQDDEELREPHRIDGPAVALA